MPNRIIKESILTSRKLNALDGDAESFFYRLLVSADDYGCFFAEADVLGGKLYPRRRMDDSKIIAMRDRLVEVGLAYLYQHDGELYIAINQWAEHQRLRQTRRKFPEPTAENIISGNLPQSAANCGNIPPRAHVTDTTRIRHESDTNPTRHESDTNSDESEGAADKIPYKEIIDHLNIQTGASYKHTSEKTKALIKARANDGFSFEDFKTVIDKKATEWTGTEWQKFLRPETLFSPKFEGYLNQQVVNRARDKPVSAIEMLRQAYEQEDAK